MISEELSNELLMPLWGLFPRSDDDPGYQDLIVRTLAKYAHNPQHGRTAVARMIETCRFKPLPVEVIEAIHATQPPPEEHWPELWRPTRSSDDAPFNGFPDLIDDHALELLRTKAEHGRTHAERECAKQFLRLRQVREKARGAAA